MWVRIMRFIVLFILFAGSFTLFAQNENAPFNSKFRLKNGIYTSNKEILNNDPRYPDYTLELYSHPLFGEAKFNYYSDDSIKKPYTDRLFALVKNGILVIYFRNEFRRLVVTGPVSIFFTEITTSYANGYSHTEDKMYYFDLKTGNIDKLNPGNLKEIFMRDHFLFTAYSKSSDSRKKRTLYATVIKYNQRNPILISTE